MSGIVTTLTAAADFPHRYVSNDNDGTHLQSGTLHEKAIVTNAEMVEHAFYQGLNLVQAMYLHAMHHFNDTHVSIQFVMLWLVTSPWLFRSLVPVSSFSHNWKLHQEKQRRNKQNENTQNNKDFQELLMYKVKKSQYIFYKHFILHGINLSVLLYADARQRIPLGPPWRVFWVLLNLSYVAEFFLQTLVKKKMLRQRTMLLCNQVLMVAASLGALTVLKDVSIPVALTSVALNFANRHHDVLNTMGIATATHFLQQYEFQ
ncbi:MAG: hypothetical protein SGARI_000284 [Bacillariaceae sp.]